MTQRGRPPLPGTAEEKAAIRREKVRLYVQNHRQRKKLNPSAAEPVTEDSSTKVATASDPPPSSSTPSSTRTSHTNNHAQLIHTDTSSEADRVKLITMRSMSQEPALQLHQSAFPALLLAIPQGNKEVAMAVLGAIRTKFLPSTIRFPSVGDYGSELVTPCSVWLTKAYSLAMAQESGALRTSLLAVGLSIVGLQNRDERVKMAAFSAYRNALRQIRLGLQLVANGQATDSLSFYLSVISVSTFEMLHNGMSNVIMHHIKGAGSLIKLFPQDPSVDRLLRDLLLEDLCVWDLMFALKNRYPSTLAAIRRQRKAKTYRIAGKEGRFTANVTLIGDLLDCADHIPAIMADVDAAQQLNRPSEKRNSLQIEREKLSIISISLDTWAENCHCRFGPAFLPVEDPIEPGDLDVRFVSYEVGIAWIFFLTLKLCATGMLIAISYTLLELSSTPEAPATLGSETPILHKLVIRQAPTISSLSTNENFNNNPGESELAARKDVKDQLLSGNHEDENGLELETHDIEHKLLDLRAQLRKLLPELLNAARLCLSASTGIIASSFVTFPLCYMGILLKEEIPRLEKDLRASAISSAQRIAIQGDLSRMLQQQAVYRAMQKAFVECNVAHLCTPEGLA